MARDRAGERDLARERGGESVDLARGLGEGDKDFSLEGDLALERAFVEEDLERLLGRRSCAA